MYIAWYISSHGFGHMTRCLSLIESILKNSEYKVYIVCHKKQNDFARIYLSKFVDRIIYKDMVTDIGFVNKKNSLEVDTVVLNEKLDVFASNLDDVVKAECEFLRTIDVKCVVSDISVIGCIVGKKLGLSNVFISNFSWVEQYEHIGLDDRIISKFREAYSYVDKFIKYDLCLPIGSINTDNVDDVGFVCRDIDKYRVMDIKKKYGDCIFITCGKSASLDSINVSNFKGTIFTTSGIDIICGDDCDVVNLPIDVLDTQNYIAASDVVIAKSGWGTIAECILGHSGLVLIERPSAKEDSFNIDCIKSRRLGISVSERDLCDIDVAKLKDDLKYSVDYDALCSYINDNNKVVDIIISTVVGS